MSFITKSPVVLGLLAGLSVPPIITKVVLVPSLIQSKYDEIDSIKHDLDYIGWHVRNMEEVKGYKEDDIYVPVSYFQGRY
ncbi:hypothetical protein HYPBUDRAFT_152670 [Hyphopichia burtonii NRRL Y-1933]|uniref:Uncharacterized protein n=1 Tax=Hyphopichia burtonii NRRL Y-1933 TaxID=984485 RepID=A0A1E4RL59_9ASCO|nr:hypothetical protein HYPBUDRAFT_152670 [Hyphopichia burtonii NRRL Y-1933]ODV67966.1 hypothetical protein HYPBUDRAFT_152670 [Hyphopichia burtonii NRRL Y-1933]